MLTYKNLWEMARTSRNYDKLLGVMLAVCALNSVQAQTPHLKVSVVQRENFDVNSNRKLDSAIVILNSILNSLDFRAQLSAINFNVGNRGLANKDIVQMILTGQNDIGKTKDYSIDLKLKLYDNYRGGGEFGYTGMQNRITSTHRCYVLHNNIKCYASHLAHEYMHQIGFYDVKSWRGARWTKTNSVPYKVGRLADKFIANNSHCVAQHSNCPKE